MQAAAEVEAEGKACGGMALPPVAAAASVAAAAAAAVHVR